MKPAEFVAKWGKLQGKESALYASHFDDVCRLVGHSTPTEYAASHDPAGADFAFQRGTTKTDGRKGYADVYFRDHFIWEYKGPHADLDKAYQQTQLYREALGNPPLLIAGDLRTIRIYSNFTNSPTVRTDVTLDDIAGGKGVDVLRRVFEDPDSFRPPDTREKITAATADTFLAVAEALRQHQSLTGEDYSSEQRAHFLIRLLFCLFAEDLGLLPDGLFTQLVAAQGNAYSDMRGPLRNLFATMRAGGYFGMWHIRHFNGTLFDDDFVPSLPYDLAGKVMRAARQNWAAIDPSIFGTLFERIIDEDKRAQLGAHYTSRDDIILIVEPVLMAPLRRRWDEVRRQTERLLSLSMPGGGAGGPGSGGEEEPPATLPPAPPLPGSPAHLLEAFAAEIAATRVLDPACGSGNFLYVALRHLLDLQKEVIAYAARKGLPDIPLTVGPEQLYGIEINEYAHELAQITVWIGYLQWRFDNGFADIGEPVLRPLRNIRHMDAILAHDQAGRPVEPEWPAAEVIVGNPPFLGDKKMRAELGDFYVDELRQIYKERIPGQSDLVCYWFERARETLLRDKAQRVGLLATNSIRGGANQAVLKRIKADGDIFMAWSDRGWILDGAAVRVSIVGFDRGLQDHRVLDGRPVTVINSDLTTTLNLVSARPLEENASLSFIGPSPHGRFDIPASLADRLLADQNSSSVSNADVVRPVVTALDIVRSNRNMWTIDFGVMSEKEAQVYQSPYEYVRTRIFPERAKNRRKNYVDYWWQYGEARPGMRMKLATLKRYISTPRVAKHRLFVWLPSNTLSNDGTVVFARDDDYFFGVLHARPHELWALRMGTSLEDRPRYTPTTTFETYPFPWPPGQEPGESGEGAVSSKQWTVSSGQSSGGSGPSSVDSEPSSVVRGPSSVDSEPSSVVRGPSSVHSEPSSVVRGPSSVDSEGVALVAEIAHWARALVKWRDAWLNPAPPPRGTIDVGYDRLLKARTLTNLYNGLVYFREHPGPAFDRAAFDQTTRRAANRDDIRELDDIHRALDAAVLRAYGWPDDLDDEAILERLLALNGVRAGRG